MTAIAHNEGVFTSKILAGSVNANPIFVKRILVKLSRAKLATTTVGKSGGYGLARSPEKITLSDIYSAINPPDAFAIHTYPIRKECVVSSNIKEVMTDVLVGTQEAIRRDLSQTTLADVVSKIRAKSD
ncbi:Rrf2 family transcriptional regulator [Serratia plymuthica]|nr:Rrf2 family transcriptional regulator [Serratia plymuthica]QPS57607.1 Rrf2 family transcriptional regulator [Serratia plymuthica]CAI1542404.1 Putative HTH-type transcriptional regulator ywnA [Serratia plymuthica]